jgi:hypothetical protein
MSFSTTAIRLASFPSGFCESSTGATTPTGASFSTRRCGAGVLALAVKLWSSIVSRSLPDHEGFRSEACCDDMSLVTKPAVARCVNVAAAKWIYENRMKELIKSNDAVLLSFIEALLKEATIPYQIADQHMSIIEGSLGVLPRRVLIHDEDYDAARRILAGAEIDLPAPYGK